MVSRLSGFSFARTQGTFPLMCSPDVTQHPRSVLKHGELSHDLDFWLFFFKIGRYGWHGPTFLQDNGQWS